MTEDEAKLTQCCGPEGCGYFNDEPRPARWCVGSACMAWRSLIRTEMRHRDGHVVQPGEIYLRGNATEHQVSDGGFCGLAGAPR
jgi:hypothetical protein